MNTEEMLALEMALEVLEEIALAGMSGTGQESEEAITEWHARQAWKFIGIAARALEPIKEALAQPEQESCGGCGGSGWVPRDPDIGTDQECFVCEGTGKNIDTTPPQRKPLTYVDLRRIANECGLGASKVSAQAQATVDNFARAIEAAHGIKE